jgi:ribosomal protein S16
VAVKIKLKRLGKIRAPYYRIVVADARTKRDGRAIEEIGKYHPKEHPSLIEVDSARVQYWLGVGAQRHSGAPKRWRARITWPFGSTPSPTTPTRNRRITNGPDISPGCSPALNGTTRSDTFASSDPRVELRGFVEFRIDTVELASASLDGRCPSVSSRREA